MINVLKKLKNERILAEFHEKKDNRKFNVGFCLDYDDEYYLIESITPKGRWDGYMCFLVDDIDFISVDTIYLNNIKKLMQHNRSYHREFPITNKSVLTQTLDYVLQSKKICTVYTIGETYLSGRITEVFNNVIFLEVLDEEGLKDGISYVSKDDIVMLSVDTEDEVKLEIISNL